MRETNLQNSKVTLQPLLLIYHQLEPAALDSCYSITGCIKTGSKNITGFLAGGFQESLDGAGRFSMMGDDHLSFWGGGHDAGKDRHAGGRVGIGGSVNFLVDHFQSSFYESILYALGTLTTTSLR
jgi:hypothetical protein